MALKQLKFTATNSIQNNSGTKLATKKPTSLETNNRKEYIKSLVKLAASLDNNKSDNPTLNGIRGLNSLIKKYNIEPYSVVFGGHKINSNATVKKLAQAIQQAWSINGYFSFNYDDEVMLDTLKIKLKHNKDGSIQKISQADAYRIARTLLGASKINSLVLYSRQQSEKIRDLEAEFKRAGYNTDDRSMFGFVSSGLDIETPYGTVKTIDEIKRDIITKDRWASDFLKPDAFKAPDLTDDLTLSNLTVSLNSDTPLTASELKDKHNINLGIHGTRIHNLLYSMSVYGYDDIKDFFIKSFKDGELTSDILIDMWAHNDDVFNLVFNYKPDNEQAYNDNKNSIINSIFDYVSADANVSTRLKQLWEDVKHDQ